MLENTTPGIRNSPSEILTLGKMKLQIEIRIKLARIYRR